MAKEQEEDQESDREARQTKVPQPVDLRFDQFGGVEADEQANPERSELLVDLLDTAAQVAAEADQVRALLLEHEEADGRLAVHPVQHLAPAGTDLDVGDVPDQHRTVWDHANFAHRHGADGTAVEHHRRSPGFVLQAAEVAKPSGRAAYGRGDLLRRHAECSAAVRVDPHGQLTRGAAAHHRLADSGHRGEPGRDQLLDQVVQGVLVVRTGRLQDHGEAREHARVVGLHVEEGVARLGAGQIRGDAAHFEFPHLEIDAPFEADGEAAGGAGDLAPGLGHPGQGSHPGFERHQDLAFNRLRLAARTEETDVERIARQRREELHR